MNEWISVNDKLPELNKRVVCAVAMVKKRSITPTVDAVPVVRCKDCKHYKDGFCYNPNTYDDEKTRGNTVPDWFCADGELES